MHFVAPGNVTHVLFMLKLVCFTHNRHALTMIPTTMGAGACMMNQS